MSISASGSSLHCVGYGSVLCSARQQTTLGLGPPLAGQSRSTVMMSYMINSTILLHKDKFGKLYCMYVQSSVVVSSRSSSRMLKSIVVESLTPGLTLSLSLDLH